MNIKIPDEFIEEIILGKIKLFTKENYFNTFSNILSKLSLDLYAFKKKESLYLSLSYKLRERNFHSNWTFIFLLIFHTKKDQIQTRLNLEPFSFHYLMNLCHLKIKKLSKLSNEVQIPLEKAVSIYLELCEKRIKTNRAEKIKKKASLIKTYRELNGKPIKFSKLLLLENDDKAKLMPKKIITKFNSNSKTLDYNNSYARLFIGETDEQSIRERYLSNMVVKKQKELHLLNSIEEFSFVYLKKMYKKLFKNEERNSMDNDMIKIMKQFEEDHKKLDNLKRTSINNDKPHYMLNYNKALLPFQSNEKKIPIKKIKNKRQRNKHNSSLFSSIEVSKYNNQDSGFSSRLKNKNHYSSSINYESNKFRDFIFEHKTIIDNYKKNKIFYPKKNIKLTKNFSTISIKPIFKINKSILFNNKKHYKLKNYMNKSDFFFNK